MTDITINYTLIDHGKNCDCPPSSCSYGILDFDGDGNAHSISAEEAQKALDMLKDLSTMLRTQEYPVRKYRVDSIEVDGIEIGNELLKKMVEEDKSCFEWGLHTFLCIPTAQIDFGELIVE